MINVSLSHEGRDHICPSWPTLCPHCWNKRMNCRLYIRSSRIYLPLFTSFPEPVPFWLSDSLLCLPVITSHSACLKWNSSASPYVLVIYCIANYPLFSNFKQQMLCVSTHSFWGSRIQERLSSVLLALSCSQVISRDPVIWRLSCSWSICIQAHSHGCGRKPVSLEHTA